MSVKMNLCVHYEINLMKIWRTKWKIFLGYYKFCLVKCCNFQLFWSPVGHNIDVLRHFCTLCVLRTSFVVKFTIFTWFLSQENILKNIFSSQGKLCTFCNITKIIFLILNNSIVFNDKKNVWLARNQKRWFLLWSQSDDTKYYFMYMNCAWFVHFHLKTH